MFFSYLGINREPQDNINVKYSTGLDLQSSWGITKTYTEVGFTKALDQAGLSCENMSFVHV